MLIRTNASKPVQRRLLVPLIIALVVLVVGFDALLLTLNYDHIHQTSEIRLEAASRDFQKSLADQSENLEAIGSTLLRDPALTEALQVGDRDRLLATYGSVFAHLLDKYKITHFYFHRPDRVNLLRVHQPNRSGDLTDRFTLLEAERTKEPASGIELGQMGTFTLRVVIPALDGDTVVGYVEIGKEIEDLLENIPRDHRVEVIASIHKNELQREQWETGMKMLGRDADWSHLANDAVIYSSVGHLRHVAAGFVSREGRQEGVMIDVEIDESRWLARTTPLSDASGVEVGDLLFLQDVSEPMAQFRRTFAIWTGLAVALATVLVVFLFLALRRVDRGIEEQAEVEAENIKVTIANSALTKACEAAEEATRAKSEFLANMSHEIRTPMTAILGFAETLLDRELSESNRFECVHTIQRNGQALLAIINDILDLSKIEAGSMRTNRTLCEPCRIIADVTALMRTQADAKGLELDVEYESAIPKTIRTDEARLRQILINLIGNAIKFTEVGSVRLVTRFANDEEEPRLEFDVIDTGRGIATEDVTQLFQPFVQADSSATRDAGGTGLGLAISQRFAEILNGHLTVAATEPGVGSTFRLTTATGVIDNVEMVEDPMSATVVPDGAATRTKNNPQLRGLRVLLAEDGPDNQRLISFVLKKAGADVTVKENGKLALDAAIAGRQNGLPFDVILMDMQMPTMDGYEATRQLRRSGYDGPIVALTAHAMAGDRQNCIDAGCDNYATKPIDRATLIDLLAQYSRRADIAA